MNRNRANSSSLKCSASRGFRARSLPSFSHWSAVKAAIGTVGAIGEATVGFISSAVLSTVFRLRPTPVCDPLPWQRQRSGSWLIEIIVRQGEDLEWSFVAKMRGRPTLGSQADRYAVAPTCIASCGGHRGALVCPCHGRPDRRCRAGGLHRRYPGHIDRGGSTQPPGYPPRGSPTHEGRRGNTREGGQRHWGRRHL